MNEKSIKELVMYFLNDVPKTRDNDNLLAAYVIKEKMGLQNTFDIALATTSNVYETVRRLRQKIQEENEDLRPSDYVAKARMKKEDEWHERYRG